MELDIHEGKRVLYKDEGRWEVGILIDAHNTYLNDKGLFVSVIPPEYLRYNDWASHVHHNVEINDLFLDARPIEDWMTQYGYLMPKEKYIEFIQSEDFDKNIEHAYVSDGEYYYYNVNKYSEQWLNKQPFDYIVREE